MCDDGEKVDGGGNENRNEHSIDEKAWVAWEKVGW